MDSPQASQAIDKKQDFTNLEELKYTDTEDNEIGLYKAMVSVVLHAPSC